MAAPATLHPTKDRLIATVVLMLDGDHPDKINVEDVLIQSGISKGSLYHHFDDFTHLIEAALVRRFSRNVDESIAVISTVVTSAHSKDEFLAGLERVTRATQSAALAPMRFERARALGMAGWNPRFRESLGSEQHRLTAGLADLFREAQSKGWLNSQFDPQAAAVLIQAYTLGQVLDDVDEDSMDREAWIQLINRIMYQVFS
jgi:AcrR family transcriptional regulator